MLLEDQIPYIMKYEAIWIQQVRDKRKSAVVPWAALCATWNTSVTEVKGLKPWHTVNTVVSHSSYAKSVARICQNFLCWWIATQFGDYLWYSAVFGCFAFWGCLVFSVLPFPSSLFELPSGKQTWQCNISHLVNWFSHQWTLHLVRGFPAARHTYEDTWR